MQHHINHAVPDCDIAYEYSWSVIIIAEQTVRYYRDGNAYIVGF